MLRANGGVALAGRSRDRRICGHRRAIETLSQWAKAGGGPHAILAFAVKRTGEAEAIRERRSNIFAGGTKLKRRGRLGGGSAPPIIDRLGNVRFRRVQRPYLATARSLAIALHVAAVDVGDRETIIHWAGAGGFREGSLTVCGIHGYRLTVRRARRGRAQCILAPANPVTIYEVDKTDGRCLGIRESHGQNELDCQ